MTVETGSITNTKRMAMCGSTEVALGARCDR
jgi:hypothetical protein